MVRQRGTDSAKVIEVVETRAVRGSGTYEDPGREVIQYWSFGGELLAEKDPTVEQVEEGGSDAKYVVGTIGADREEKITEVQFIVPGNRWKELEASAEWKRFIQKLGKAQREGE